MARPTLLTPELQAEICASIEAGNYRSTACGTVGIHRHTLQNWEKAGLEGREPYASFLEAMTAAESKSEAALLEAINSAKAGVTGVSGADVWQNKAWIMERRFASRWAGRVKQQVAENVDALLDKVKAEPELHKKLVEMLTDAETATH